MLIIVPEPLNHVSPGAWVPIGGGGAPVVHSARGYDSSSWPSPSVATSPTLAGLGVVFGFLGSSAVCLHDTILLRR